MVLVGGFFQDPAVEVQPGQLAIDETFRQAGERQLGRRVRHPVCVVTFRPS
jgi:hypothetical protein